MAIKINNVDVITNSPNIVNVTHGNFSGIVTATSFVGSGSQLTGVGSKPYALGMTLVFGN